MYKSVLFLSLDNIMKGNVHLKIKTNVSFFFFLNNLIFE